MYAILDRLTDTLDLPRERPDTHTSAADRIDAMKAAVGAADGKSPDEAKRLLTNPSRSNSNPH